MLAFQSDELDLTDADRAAARQQYQQLQAGQLGEFPTAAKLIEGLRKRGVRDDTYLTSALVLDLDEYRRVEEVYKGLPAKPATWRHASS